MKKYKQTIIPEASTETWKGLSKYETRKKVFEYYTKHYPTTKKVINQSMNIPVSFDRIGAKKTGFGGSIYPKKACLVEILDKLIRYAEYNNWGDRKDKDDIRVIGYMNFKVKAFIDGKMEYVHLYITVRNNGSFHYSLEVNIW